MIPANDIALTFFVLKDIILFPNTKQIQTIDKCKYSKRLLNLSRETSATDPSCRKANESVL